VKATSVAEHRVVGVFGTTVDRKSSKAGPTTTSWIGGLSEKNALCCRGHRFFG
jgi:hypothetical protein